MPKDQYIYKKSKLLTIAVAFSLGTFTVASHATLSVTSTFSDNHPAVTRNNASVFLAANNSIKQTSSLYNRRGLPNRYGGMKKKPKEEKKEPSFKLFPDIQKKSGFGAFINDSTANIEFHSTYIRVANSGEDESKDWHGATVGTKLNFESGYAFNHIGVDWSSYATMKLDRGGNRDEFSLLKQKNDGKYPDSAFYPDGHLYMKFKAGEDKNGIKAQAGFLPITSDFIASSGSYDTESSYRAIHFEGDSSGSHVYLNLANAQRKRTEHGPVQFKSASDEHISWIGEVGVNHKFDNELLLDLSYGEGHDYIKTYELEVKYPLEIPGGKLDFHGQFIRAWRGGKLWSEAEDLFKSSSTEMVFSTDYTWKDLTLTGAYAKVKARGGKGQHQYALADNAYDPNNTVTAQNDDYNYDGQESFLVSAEYKVPVLPGLKLGVTYVNGDGIDYKDNANIKFKEEHELDYSLTYDFRQKYLKGLSLSVTDYNLFQTRVTSGAQRTSEIDAFLNYKVALF